MIVTSSRQTVSPKATVINSPRASIFSAAYSGFTKITTALGYYQDIKPYLPEYYLDKYRYKPRKRVAGYLGKAVWSKKNFRKYNKFRKARSACDNPGSLYKCSKNTGKSSYRTK